MSAVATAIPTVEPVNQMAITDIKRFTDTILYEFSQPERWAELLAIVPNAVRIECPNAQGIEDRGLCLFSVLDHEHQRQGYISFNKAPFFNCCGVEEIGNIVAYVYSPQSPSFSARLTALFLRVIVDAYRTWTKLNKPYGRGALVYATTVRQLYLIEPLRAAGFEPMGPKFVNPRTNAVIQTWICVLHKKPKEESTL